MKKKQKKKKMNQYDNDRNRPPFPARVNSSGGWRMDESRSLVAVSVFEFI